MKKIAEFFKKEAVLCISGILAIISCFFVLPSAAYLEYIDLRVLILLLCLMLVVAGIRQTGAFTVICEALLKKFRSIKIVGLMMVLLSYFLSMLLTNDVALVTLVPFTLLMFEKIEGEKKSKALIVLLVLETAAANLGSMLTPMGNPQNLYLYSKFELSIGEFFGIIFPYSALSLVMVVCSVLLFLPKLEVERPKDSSKINGRVKLILFAVLFIVCMLTILRILNDKILLIIVAAAVLILDRKLFLQADYSLLLTFVFFFVFVGNLGSIPTLSDGLKSVFQGYSDDSGAAVGVDSILFDVSSADAGVDSILFDVSSADAGVDSILFDVSSADAKLVIISIALSQVISNVPAALLLSGISDNFRALIIGVNLGGLGTLIASMASLITYKFYANSKDSSPKKYILTFTAFSLCYLAVLGILYFIVG